MSEISKFIFTGIALVGAIAADDVLHTESYNEKFVATMLIIMGISIFILLLIIHQLEQDAK